MKGYRKSTKGDVKCRDCAHGRVAGACGAWHKCLYFVSHDNRGMGAIKKVSRLGTCDQAVARVDAAGQKR